MAKLDDQVECPYCGAVFEVPQGGAAGERTCPVCRASVAISAQEPSGTAPERALEEPWEPAAPAGFGADESAPALVCCVREEKVNVFDAGPLVEEFSGLTARDARRRVVQGKGILLEDVSLAVARTVVEGLGARGIQAFALPAAAVPAVERALSLVRVYGADERALHIQTDAQGTVESVPWAKLVAGTCVRPASLRAAGMELEAADTSVPVVTAGLGFGLLRRRRYRRKPRRPALEAKVVLVLRGRAGRAYLLPFAEGQVRYAYLGERMLPSQEQNLSLLLGDVLDWCGEAFFPAGFRAAARGDMASATKVLGKVEYDNYLRWTICCAVVRGLFSGS